MATPEQYPWLRREDETSRAYEAFKIYLEMGPDRSCKRVGEEVGKSTTLMENWSADNLWVERVRAFEQFLMEAQTDGYASELASVRERHMAIAAKLMGHLDARLDDFIRTKSDPTIRWTNAFVAAAKVDQTALTLREDAKSAEQLDRVEKLVEKLMGEAVTG